MLLAQVQLLVIEVELYVTRSLYRVRELLLLGRFQGKRR